MYCKLLQNFYWLRKMILCGALVQVLCLSMAFGQEQHVTGKVTSSDDQLALPGVNILVKGTTKGTVTDAEGNYSIDVPGEESILVFSAIGYATEEVAVNGRTRIDMVMLLDVTQLSEVVVVGYGTVKKSDVTGALVSVSADVLKERPVQNVFQALQGKAAGVNISSNFKPGELPVVRVRGNRSFETNGASNEPLYVVDGIPLVNILGVNSFSISDLNPNDIASVEILKDASATAIYGSRGANGVVLITTKKGSKDKVSINYNGTVSFDSYKSLTDWMNGGEYVDRWRLALINGRQYKDLGSGNSNLDVPALSWYPDPALDATKFGLTPGTTEYESVMMGYEWEDEIGGTVKMRPTTAEEQALGWPAEVPVYNSKNVRSFDWLDAATRQGVTNNHQISISSGTEKSHMYLSFGYYNQNGVQRDQDYKRYNISVSGESTAADRITLGTNILASHSVQNFGILPPNTSNTGSKDLYSRATDQFPYMLPVDADGNVVRSSSANPNLYNPLIDIEQSLNERRSSSVLASLYSEVKFTPWLKYRINFGAQYRQFRNGQWTGPNVTSHLNQTSNTARYNTEENFSWVMENLLYLDKTFADIHTIGVTLLQSTQKSRKESIGANVNQSIYDISYWYDLASNLAGQPAGYGTDFTENTLMSYMGRINYTLMNKYLFTATGRFDGASVLAPGHKWDFFPSFAFAWKMHEESFLGGLDWIDELKPRFGYGVTGNSSVPPYTTSGPLSRNPYAFTQPNNGTTIAAIGYLPQLVKNPDLGWEKTAQWNIGVDFSLLRTRLSGSIEVYEANTRDLILLKALPAVSGYVSKFENVGKTRNRGVEITLSSVNIEKGDFSWSTDLNWAKNKEEVVELFNGTEDLIGQGLFIGQPVNGVFRQYDNAGIWTDSDDDLAEMAKFRANGVNFYPGTIKVVDQNGDYKIDSDDYVIRGNNRPKWSGGITNTFKYKNWTLSAFIYARVGQTYFGGYPNSYGGINPNGRVENDIWSFDNQGGRWPMPNTGNITNYTAAMQYNNGSFAVVRNISLSYTVPTSFLQRIAVKDLQVTAQILNPFIFGGEVVKWGLNPDDDTNWERASSNTNPLGGTNNNTILPQSFVIGVRAGL